MYANHPEMAKRWSKHEDSFPSAYEDEGLTTEQAVELASTRGSTAMEQLRAGLELRETGRENSTAMLVVPGGPPGRNLCAFVRSLTANRSKLIVVNQSSDGLGPGGFERLLRASMPDCEKKLRVVDGGSSLADAVSSAERNRHYRPSQALEVFCDPEVARGFSQEVRDGALKFDPTVIRILPQKIPSDDGADITRAIQTDDQAAMHRVLDPHVFSNQDSIADYRQALMHEKVVREFLSDIAPSRDLAIRTLHDIVTDTLGAEADGLQYLGTGRNGSAYRHPDGFIVKVTTDSIEVDSASKLEGLQPDHLGRIFAVRPVGKGIWMLIQEDLERLPAKYSEEFDIAMEVLELIGVMDDLNAGDCATVIDALASHPDIELAALAADAMLRFDVPGMCYELSRLGLTADFHSGNVMLRSGSPVLVDLGTPGDDPGRIDEFGTGAPGSGANGPAQMRGSNSSSWSSGQLALKRPENHVPEDDNATERDTALDWGPGRTSGASF